MLFLEVEYRGLIEQPSKLVAWGPEQMYKDDIKKRLKIEVLHLRPSRARTYRAYGPTIAASTAVGQTSKRYGYLNLFFLDRTIIFITYLVALWF